MSSRVRVGEHPDFQPKALTLYGSYPRSGRTDMGIRWVEGQRLVVATGQPYEISAEDLAQLLNQRQQSAGEKGNKQVLTVDTLQTSVISSCNNLA